MTPGLLASAIDQAGEAILVTSVDGRILYANPAFERMTGYGAADLSGRPAGEALGLEHSSPGIRRDLERTLSSGRVWRGELTGCRSDGVVFRWQNTVTPVRDAGGAVQAFLSICQDPTARQDVEARLRQSQKMEAVGRLAGGIAHDFNNLLTVITGYGDQLVAGLDGKPELKRAAEAVKAAASRAGALTRQLLAFSRRQLLAPRPLDVNAVVADMHKLLRRLIGEDIQLVLKLAPGCARVKADPNQLEQVVMNLAINARDAMPRGGTLTIQTAIADLDGAFTAAHAGLVPGRYVMLLLEDDGCGMDAETMAHLFEPFFTTKEPGKGTGLGLCTTYGIIKQSDGYIYARSTVGEGTTFTVCLPYLECAEEVAAAELSFTEPPRGSGTILVVEDEEDVRRLVGDTLRTCGYEVLEASSAAAALEAVERRQAPVDLVVTDVVMAQMNGWDLAASIGRVRAGTPVLFMSGHAGHPALERSVSASAVPFLAKPFTARQLACAVRDTIHKTFAK
ncbi:MAG TPA: response regulator [Vicinamibacterales bacterium]|nr:response regulator [Vicinamibacterales bacterium]